MLANILDEQTELEVRVALGPQRLRPSARPPPLIVSTSSFTLPLTFPHTHTFPHTYPPSHTFSSLSSR